MRPPRRRLLLAGAAWLGGGLVGPAQATAPASSVRRGQALVFPRDHGAHPDARIEWWYLTGWLSASGANEPSHGFQVTFFRSRTTFGPAAGAPRQPPGRFEPRHLLLAHAAVTDLAAGRHHHAQRIGRWSGEPEAGPDRAALHDADVRLGPWRLARFEPGTAGAEGKPSAAQWRTRVQADSFALDGTFTATQPLLLQGDDGFSRKGPQEPQASHYYSWPQLAAELTLELNGRRLPARGRAWLDQEWSDELMHPEAIGWDWIGINLFDGSALTAFRLRRADGSALWAGGSHRAPGGPGRFVRRIFEAAEVRFEPGRLWRSPATHASYPMQWEVHTPAGRFGVRALLDAQELASRPGSGAVYWEGLAELLDGSGRRVGLGYLEMTGYAAPLKLG